MEKQIIKIGNTYPTIEDQKRSVENRKNIAKIEQAEAIELWETNREIISEIVDALTDTISECVERSSKYKNDKGELEGYPNEELWRLSSRTFALSETIKLLSTIERSQIELREYELMKALTDNNILM